LVSGFTVGAHGNGIMIPHFDDQSNTLVNRDDKFVYIEKGCPNPGQPF
jgi:hypothetical protein